MIYGDRKLKSLRPLHEIMTSGRKDQAMIRTETDKERKLVMAVSEERSEEERRFCPFMLFSNKDKEDILEQTNWCRKDWCEWFDQPMDCCAIRSTPSVLRTFSFMIADKLDERDSEKK